MANLKVKKMFEIIEVHSWDSITRTPFQAHHLFWIRVKDKNTITRIAENYNIPFIFKKGKELLCSKDGIIYWYK